MTAFVYRLHDGEGNLLYVGSSVNPDRRLGFHRTQAPWWYLVQSKLLAEFPSLIEARKAEAAAILDEQPIFNYQHKRPLCIEDGCTYAATADRQHCYKHGEPVALPADDQRHGRLSTYMNYRCRCSACKAARRDYDQAKRVAA